MLLTKYESSGPCGFGEEDFFYVFPIESLWELMTPGAGPFSDPRGMIGRIYKKDHYTLLHTKYEGSVPCGFGEEDFLMFCPITPPGRGLYGPQGHGWRIYKEDHYTLLHTKHERSGTCGFGEEDFFMFFPL